MLKFDKLEDNLDKAQASQHSFNSFGGCLDLNQGKHLLIVGGNVSAPNGSPLGVYN